MRHGIKLLAITGLIAMALVPTRQAAAYSIADAQFVLRNFSIGLTGFQGLGPACVELSDPGYPGVSVDWSGTFFSSTVQVTNRSYGVTTIDSAMFLEPTCQASEGRSSVDHGDVQVTSTAIASEETANFPYKGITARSSFGYSPVLFYLNLVEGDVLNVDVLGDYLLAASTSSVDGVDAQSSVSFELALELRRYTPYCEGSFCSYYFALVDDETIHLDTSAGWPFSATESTLGGTFRSPYSFAIDTSGYYWIYAAAAVNTRASMFVPEPGTFALLGLGLAGVGVTRRRRTESTNHVVGRHVLKWRQREAPPMVSRPRLLAVRALWYFRT